MKRYRYMALAFLTVVLAIGLFFSLLPKEPVYEGRPIGAWIGQLTGGVGSSAGAVSYRDCQCSGPSPAAASSARRRFLASCSVL